VIDNQPMTRVSVEQIESDLAAYLKRVEDGETLLVVRLDKPVAELRPIAKESAGQRRPFALCAGEFTVPDDFDAPLPEEVLADFEGR
jgi:antitoxin (DNA-binding transcriptional repressor) of toxin-antitoxin stability system